MCSEKGKEEKISYDCVGAWQEVRETDHILIKQSQQQRKGKMKKEIKWKWTYWRGREEEEETSDLIHFL